MHSRSLSRPRSDVRNRICRSKKLVSGLVANAAYGQKRKFRYLALIDDLLEFAMNLELAATFFRELQKKTLSVSSEWAIDSWQLSYVWCVQDALANNRNIEEFLAKSYSRHPYSTNWVGKPPWENQVDMPTWLTKLALTPVTQSAVQNVISVALDRADDAEDLDLGQAFRSLLCSVEVPAQGWSITEIEAPRNPVGATDIVVFQTGKDYFFLETPLES